jgi:tetratricopeptide (TPR) repeat protein
MRIQVLISLFILNANLAVSQVSLKEIDLENGEYKVGFHHYLTSDSTRTYQRKMDWNIKFIPRPIPVSIWYPSKRAISDLEPLTVLDYMEILKEEEEWEYLPNEQILNWFYYPNTTSNRNHLDEKSTAFKGLETINEKFPVVVYAPSYQASSIENFALFEYLASHGYVVISSPSHGSENRWLAGGTAKDVETQARDIEFLISEVAKFPYAAFNNIATMGFSFGGLSNVLSQIRNDNIKAILSLDGSIKYQYTTLKSSPFFDIKKVDVPFIHMSQKDIPEQVLNEDKIDAGLNYKFEFYHSLVNSLAYQLKFNNLTHSYFSTLGVLFQTRDIRQDNSNSEIMESYKLVSLYTLNFLNAFLKNNANAIKFLNREPSDNGIEKTLITWQYKQPTNSRFSFQDFNELAAKQNYRNLKKLYESLINQHPTMEIPEGDLNNLGLQLVYNPKTSEQGINVFLLATTIYPSSANIFDSLAEGYLYIGNKNKAMINFQRSLKLNPENLNAINRLKELKD